MKTVHGLIVFRFIIVILILISFNDQGYAVQYNHISSSRESIQLKYWQITKDTDPQNTLHTPPDSSWQLVNSSLDIDKYTEGNWLLRTDIFIDDSISDKVILGLFPQNFVTSYGIYWDGMKIAQNGIIGVNNTDEKAGAYNFNLPLPHQFVTKGKHTLILRISNHHNYSSWKWFYGDLIIGPYDVELKKIYSSQYEAFFLTGIIFIPFLFNLFLYIARKRRTEHLLFSLICFLVILDSLMLLIPVFMDVPTTYAHWEINTWQAITVLVTCLFPAFFIYSFEFPKKIIWGIIATNLFIYFFFTNVGNVFNIMTLAVLIISSIITLWALYKRQEGSLIISIGLIAAWIAYYFNFAFGGLASTMVICTSFSIARQFARKEKAEREAHLRSAHLENELLKKNINPHFILNTLTSVIVWLRKDPSSAIKLIEALAEEFRIINHISALKQIPIQQEIDLCKAHLKIMSYRKGAEYRLETIGIEEEDNVPPMIFHTLIENGLTHGYENKACGTFTLQRIKNSNCVQYILSNDGDFNSDESKDSSGFGLRYIKSRLEESYQGRWEIISHRKSTGWETIINIKAT